MRFRRHRKGSDSVRKYATKQFELGNAYAQLPAGTGRPTWPGPSLLHRGPPLPHPRGRPATYAATQNNLGNAYRELPGGTGRPTCPGPSPATSRPSASTPPRPPRSTTPRPRTTWATPTPSLPGGTGRPTWAGRSPATSEALRVRTPEAAPLDYAATQNNLGNAYAQLAGGDRAANLARAIACYSEALRFYTAEAAPLDYATTQNNLGIAYREVAGGDRAANLGRAIACYERGPPLLHRRGRPARLRHDPEQPGQRLRPASRRGPGGQPGPGHRLLRARPCASAPPRPPRSTTPRPRTTWASPTASFPAGTGRPTWRRAIACYERGPPLLHPRGRPARLRHDPEQPGHRLRRACRRGPGGQPAPGHRLLRAGPALPHRRGRPAATTPRPRTTWATPTRSLPVGDRAANLAQGHRLLRARPSGSAPPRPPRSTTPRPRTTWATPTLELAGGDRAANLDRAIACYSEALRFHTPEAAPLDYAATQNNLGVAYCQLPGGGPGGQPAPGHRLLQRGPPLPHRRGRPARLRHDPEQPGQRLSRASRRGPGGQPAAGHRLLRARPCASAPPRPPR